DNKEILVNIDLIQYVEARPDTIITLTTGEKLIVKESPQEIISKIIEFKKKIFQKE
ncbi:MAG: flagellar FlbD family protein, partial [Candidatus Omnitrophica bacterium]|nr:flagellar FlbD family protein [Candidatus Omnitrophota bacterium]